jgi:hypothetical protein
VATLPCMCGGLWMSAVSQTGVTSTKGPWFNQWDLFVTVNRLGREADFSHLLLWWKKRWTSPLPQHPCPLLTQSQQNVTWRHSV